MTRRRSLRHEFVEFVPADLETGVLYVSMTYATAVHRCCCGCGREVVTPLTPTDWVLVFDGETVSLSPSIGNWSFPCRSHYWIERNRVIWARSWSTSEVKAARSRDQQVKAQYYRKRARAWSDDEVSAPSRSPVALWQRLRTFVRGRRR